VTLRRPSGWSVERGSARPDANDRAERDRIGSDDVATKRTLEDRIMQLEAQLAHERPLLEELNRRLRADRVRIEV
jgi:hypothetical protein